MIRLTRLDGSEIYLNEDLIEIIEETPDTHLTLTNGNRYLVLEKTLIIIERIVSCKTRIMLRAQGGPGKKYLRRRNADSLHPYSRL
jgi:flagellar protein FlbD